MHPRRGPGAIAFSAAAKTATLPSASSPTLRISANATALCAAQQGNTSSDFLQRAVGHACRVPRDNSLCPRAVPTPPVSSAHAVASGVVPWTKTRKRTAQHARLGDSWTRWVRATRPPSSRAMRAQLGGSKLSRAKRDALSAHSVHRGSTPSVRTHA